MLCECSSKEEFPLSDSCTYLQLELELIQTQMTQRPMLRAEVYARALHASQNRKENSVYRAGSIILSSPSKVETVHEIILKPDISHFCVCFCIGASTPFYSLPGAPRQEPSLLLWYKSGVAPR